MMFICTNYEKDKCPIECTATSCKEFNPTEELWNWMKEEAVILRRRG